MKKYISLISALALGTTTSLTAVACGNNSEADSTKIKNLKSSDSIAAILKNINNQELYNLISDNDAKTQISKLLNQTKVTNPNEASAHVKSLKNTIIGLDWNQPDKAAFNKNVTKPLTSLLNYLNKGQWTQKQQTTPAIDKTGTNLKKFMDNWVDENGKPYSQWNNGNNWSIQSYVTDWTQNDYNFYRSGALINHLFYQIGKDYKITNPQTNEYKDRYLGDIISNHMIIVDGVPLTNQKELMDDLNQYTLHLLENPSYTITLTEALVPIIKQWVLNMDDITQGLKYLTTGKNHPTDAKNNSYNVRDILNNLNYLINHPGSANDNKTDTLYYIISSLLGMNPNSIGQTFTYDMKITTKLYGTTIELPLGAVTSMNSEQVQPLIKHLTNLISSDQVKNTFKGILNVYDKWISQYDSKDQEIVVDLEKWQNVLLNETIGLIPSINNAINSTNSGSLFNIMTNKELINDKQYFNFYETLGGVLPDTNGNITTEFKTNSLLEILKNGVNNSNTPLGQVVEVLLGNDDITGILSFIINKKQY